MDTLPPAGKSATTAITNYMVPLAREERAEHICFLLALRATETYVLSKTFKDVTKLPADSKKSIRVTRAETLQEISQLIIVYEVCYNLPSGDSSEN